MGAGLREHVQEQLRKRLSDRFLFMHQDEADYALPERFLERLVAHAKRVHEAHPLATLVAHPQRLFGADELLIS
jgi:hypothetical protein